MTLGVLINFNSETIIEKEFEKARELGLSHCQLCTWDTSLYTDGNAKKINEAL